jgi:hypothetical protein
VPLNEVKDKIIDEIRDQMTGNLLPELNQNVIIGCSSEGRGQVKLFTSKDLDHIHSFDSGD